MLALSDEAVARLVRGAREEPRHKHGALGCEERTGQSAVLTRAYRAHSVRIAAHAPKSGDLLLGIQGILWAKQYLCYSLSHLLV